MATIKFFFCYSGASDSTPCNVLNPPKNGHTLKLSRDLSRLTFSYECVILIFLMFPSRHADSWKKVEKQAQTFFPTPPLCHPYRDLIYVGNS